MTVPQSTNGKIDHRSPSSPAASKRPQSLHIESLETRLSLVTSLIPTLAGYALTSLVSCTVTQPQIISLPPVASGTIAQSSSPNLPGTTVATIAAPTGLQIRGVNSSMVSLDWKAVQGATGYRIEHSTDGVSFKGIVTVGALSYPTCLDAGLSSNTQYYYRVIALAGSRESVASVVVSTTTSAAATSALLPSAAPAPTQALMTSSPPTSQTTSALKRLTLSTDGFAIKDGSVQSASQGFQLSGFGTVKPTLKNGALTYVYTGWTIALTPTEDASGIHFAISITNTGSKASIVPDFTLGGLTGSLKDMWANNQTAPFVLDQTLADGSHLALTIDDPTYPIVAEFVHASSNPANTIQNIVFHPTGSKYVRYDLGLVPVSVAPGASTTIRASLRFGKDSASVSAAADAAWAKAYPYALQWTDHRTMLRGSMFGATISAANPEGFLGGFDINLPANAQKFDNWVMTYVAKSIATCKAINAGTWIEWNLEGMQNGFNYKGNPELIDVLNPGWAHKDASGVKLIDRFFKAFQNAGIHVGVALRPWTLDVQADGTLKVDKSVSGVESVANHIDYAYKRWGIDAFYLDSPELHQTAAYRSMMLARPKVLLIPEDVPESWLQFSAPLVWASGDNINWVSVPRNIYGNQGWGVYFHQNLTDPVVAARFLLDAKLGSTAMPDGWLGPTYAQLAADLIKKARGI